MAGPYPTSYCDLEVKFSIPKSPAVNKATVHYAQAGNPSLPTVLLLHGFPFSSNQYRDLLPMLSDKYYVLAPDYPGFGLTTVSEDFKYNFENITIVMEAWLRGLAIDEAAIYIQDYGAPVALRLATTNRLKLTAIVTQNGNAYKAGLGEPWAPIMDLWKDASAEARKMVADSLLTLEGTKAQFVAGTPEKDLGLLDPHVWVSAYLMNIAGPVNTERQLDLLYDYRTNIELYPTFHKYFRDSKVPILAVWGKGDPLFVPAGAEAFRADSPDVNIHFVDAGHCALETTRWEIARLMRQFLSEVGY